MAAAMEPAPGLLALPDDLLAVCLSSADARELGRLASVCRRLRLVVDQLCAPSLSELRVDARGSALRWAAARCLRLRRLELADCAAAEGDLRALLQRCSPTLRVLSLLRLRHLRDSVMLSAPLPRLRELSLSGCRQLGDAQLAVLFLRACPTELEVLDLSDTGVSDASLQLLARCPRLSHVRLGYSVEADGAAYCLTSAHGARAREREALTHLGLAAWLGAAAEPAALRSLSLPHRKGVRQAELQELLSTRAPALTALDVSHCNLDGSALLSVLLFAPCAPLLEELRLAAPALGGALGAAEAAALAARAPRLRVLDLSTWRLEGGALAALAGLRALEELTLVRCGGGESVAALEALLAGGARLRRLRCVRCAGLPERAVRELAARHPTVRVSHD